MELRKELMPPILDEELVARLAELADCLDGSRPGQCDGELSEFNHLAGTNLPLLEFQGIYGSMDHADWVRLMLWQQKIKPAPNVTRNELIEVVRRAMPQNEYREQHEAYMIVFDANVPLERASYLIFYPKDYDAKTNTWGNGQPINEYDPTPEQIVDWAVAPGDG